MELREYLREMRERTPGWLERFRAGDSFDRDGFFSSRLVYYPGSGTDGHAVKVFGSAHAAHCFIYVDYGRTRADLESQLADPTQRFRGYHTLSRLELDPSHVVPSSWVPHAPSGRAGGDAHARAPTFAFLEVLERDDEHDDAHGAHRLAILFLGADGIATYDVLFCQNSGSPPFAVVIQDHGFGGNYDRFGREGLLEQIATRSDVLPPFQLVAEDSVAWHGYLPVRDVAGERGGTHGRLRALFARSGAAGRVAPRWPRSMP
jgi:hypothetical protein